MAKTRQHNRRRLLRPHVRRAPSIELDRKTARGIITLLGVCQTYLEVEIDSHVIQGTNEAGPGYKRIVRQARRNWRDCEDVIRTLEGR